MIDPMNGLLSQVSEGFDWTQLLIIGLVILLPILNTIKDSFVKHAEKKREERKSTLKSLQRVIGQGAAGVARPPVARPMPMRPSPSATAGGQSGLQRRQTPDQPAPAKPAARATPQSVSRRTVISAAESVAHAAGKEPKKSGRPKPAAARKKKAAAEVSAPLPVRRISTRDSSDAPAPITVNLAESIRDRHMGKADAVVDLRIPSFELETAAAKAAGLRVTADELRRYIIMSEVLGPPVALQDPARRLSF